MRRVSDAYKRILEGMTLFATIRVSSEEDLLSHPVFMSVAANSVMSNKNSANLLGSRTLVGSGHIAISLDILCHKRGQSTSHWKRVTSLPLLRAEKHTPASNTLYEIMGRINKRLQTPRRLGSPPNRKTE